MNEREQPMPKTPERLTPPTEAPTLGRRTLRGLCVARLHDLGGMRGFGPIPNRSVHRISKPAWANEVMALELALRKKGYHTLHHLRAARETLDAHLVLNASYHALRLWATEILVIDAVREGRAAPRPIISETTEVLSVGDRVRVSTDNPVGHSRVPNYLRGRVGVIERVGSPKVYPPDITSNAVPTRAAPVYTILFGSSELWGSAGASDCVVLADLWSFDVYPIALPCAQSP